MYIIEEVMAIVNIDKIFYFYHFPLHTRTVSSITQNILSWFIISVWRHQLTIVFRAIRSTDRAYLNIWRHHVVYHVVCRMAYHVVYHVVYHVTSHV